MMLPGNNLRDNLFMTPRIKCPWCKSDALSEDQGHECGYRWFIGCVNDDCEVKPSLLADSEKEALDIWNKPSM